ncbi:MAG: ribosome biogenesis GTPase Der [Ectothiorhodospiraceae bacterium]|nr:ribosome biogenesis GTPase Der [Chromatiales bacterium]MCP5154985.1 ribosome biogenesis GTPase Der [Ectothiorhodospiraceae bacterium]
MLPVVAIVGRPNVGKSTLFNCLTRTNEALIADAPGMTRDRHYGVARHGEHRFVVVDTGGLDDSDDAIARLVSTQALRAATEADVILLVTDARDGLTAADADIADRLRRIGRPMVAVVNKVDGVDVVAATAEAHRLGIDPVLAVSAVHRRGLEPLLRAIRSHLPPPDTDDAEGERAPGARVAFVGRPNVGKSTLVNRLVGEERVIAHDMPGTTRDSIEVPFEREGRAYVLIDTAGLRRRARVSERIEQVSAIRTLQAVEACEVVVVVLDGTEGVTDQDLALIGQVVDAGRALVIAVNKWDQVAADDRDMVRLELERRLGFVDYARVQFVSALRGSGVDVLMRRVDEAHAGARRQLSTPELTRILHDAVQANPPPTVRGRRIKLRYAHQGGSAPPTVVIHGNQTEHVPGHYRRYLARIFREAFQLTGTPIRIELRTGENPYQGRRNPLTPRQQRRRARLVRHVKKGR